MKRAVLPAVMTSAAVIAMVSFVSLTSSTAAAQAGREAGAPKAAPAPAVPRMPDGHPDLTGVWWPGRDINPQTSTAYYAPPRAGAPAEPPSFSSLYQPWAAEKAKSMGHKDDPALWCIPSIIGPNPVGNGLVGEIVQTAKTVVMLIETYHGFRIVPTDGRPHRDDVVPSYKGDAVGRWEGDTLVVDVTNFSDKNWLNHHGNVSFHSDALHMVERYRLIDGNTLEINVTAEDRKVLTAPWKSRPTKLVRAPFEHVMETACEIDAIPSLMDAAAKDNYGLKK
jgi:hypothetical protein